MTTNKKSPRVFLGGTCNESKWRDEMESLLEEEGMEYFNPVVDDWNEESKQRELREREECDFCLYCITPKMIGTYSIAEVIDDCNKRPRKTVFVLLRDDIDDRFTNAQYKSLKAVADMVIRNGGRAFFSLKQAAKHICDSDFYNHIDVELGKAMTEVANSVYEASGIFERLEHEGKVVGNGHHMMQKVAMFAEKLMIDRWSYHEE